MKHIKEMLGELTDAELQDTKCFIESVLNERSNVKVTDKVYKLANVIQQIVDLNYTLRASSTTNATCPTYFLEDKNGTEQYRIIPDYPNYRECGEFGMIINKWNSKKGIWEDITNGCLYKVIQCGEI